MKSSIWLFSSYSYNITSNSKHKVWCWKRSRCHLRALIVQNFPWGGSTTAAYSLLRWPDHHSSARSGPECSCDDYHKLKCYHKEHSNEGVSVSNNRSYSVTYCLTTIESFRDREIFWDWQLSMKIIPLKICSSNKMALLERHDLLPWNFGWWQSTKNSPSKIFCHTVCTTVCVPIFEVRNFCGFRVSTKFSSLKMNNYQVSSNPQWKTCDPQK